MDYLKRQHQMTIPGTITLVTDNSLFLPTTELTASAADHSFIPVGQLLEINAQIANVYDACIKSLIIGFMSNDVDTNGGV